MNNIPPDFQRHDESSPLTDPWEPLYSKRTEDQLFMGIWADTPHCNARGFIHGGLIAALADKTMGHSCGLGHKTATSMVTVSLSVDYLGIAQTGTWIEFQPKITKNGKTLCFAECQVFTDGKLCARAQGTFMVIA